MSKATKTTPPVVLPILFAGVVGFVGSFVGGDKRVIPRDDAELRSDVQNFTSVLDGEKPALTASEYESVTSLEWRRSIPLGPHECVMLAVGASETDFVIQHQVPSEPRRDRQNALSLCAEDEATSAEYVATFTEPPGRIYFEEHRTGPNELNQYTIAANFLNPAYLAERWPRELARRIAYRREGEMTGELLSGPHRMGPGSAALLIPDDEQMVRVARESAFLGLPTSDVEFYVQSVSGETRGSVAPSVRVNGTLQPLLVAIDARADAFCTAVEIWPTQETHQAIGAITHPGAVVTQDIGNRAVVCPQDGVTLFYASSATYDVYLRRAQAAEPVERRHVPMTMSQPLRDALAACEGGDAGACRQASSCYETGVGTVPDLAKATRLARRACELGPRYCLDAAGFLSGARQHAALLRACRAGGQRNACALLGARYRLGEGVAVNYAYARAFYEHACSMGAACDESRHMVDLELTTPEAGDDAAIALGFASADEGP
ncbi:MAG: tetratricopeptide repeat protein [Polyangiales bacterium]